MSTAKLVTVSAALLPLSIVRAIWKHKVMVLLVCIVGSALAVLGVLTIPPVYQADAVVQIETAAIPAYLVTPTVQSAQEARLDHLKAMVLSHDRLWSLIQDLGLYPGLRQTLTRDEVLVRMREDLQITMDRAWSGNRPATFRVSYAYSSATTAAEVCNRVAGVFIDEDRRQLLEEARSTSAFLDSQLAEAKTRLDEQEDRLRSFKMARNGELPEQEPSLLANMSQAKTELMGLQEELSRAHDNKLILESSLAVAQTTERQWNNVAKARDEQDTNAPSAQSAAPAPSPVQVQLDQARARLKDLRVRYEEQHPEIQRTLEEIAYLERELQSQQSAAVPNPVIPPPAKPRTPSPAVAAVDERNPMSDKVDTLKRQIAFVDNDINTLEQRRQRLLASVTDAQRRLSMVPIRQQELASLMRDDQSSKMYYQTLLDKKLLADEGADLEHTRNGERLVLLEAAQPPAKPARPNRPAFIAVGVILALCIAAVIGFVVEWKNDVLLGEWELPDWAPVLGCVPVMDTRSLAAGRERS
jgi:polysaccharide chain length determinant protein (PEP-CTERM system associated)